MRHLEQDSRTLTGIFFAAPRPAVVEIFQNGQRFLDDFMGFLTLDIDDESDATGIVLKPRIIKALFGRKVGNLHIRILCGLDRCCWSYKKRMRESPYGGTPWQTVRPYRETHLASMIICDRSITFFSRWNVLPNFDRDPRFGSPSPWKAQPSCPSALLLPQKEFHLVIFPKSRCSLISL